MSFKRDSQKSRNRPGFIEFSSARGSYERVLDGQSTSKSTLLQRLFKLGPIIALFLLGQILMVVHHLLYAHLNEKSTDSAAGELPVFLRNQNNVNFIGTAIAHGARILLSTAVGATFAQLFWETLRSRSHTIQQIDALVKCGESPFHFSAFRAAATSFAIFLVSSIASAMALLVIITPGSLTVSMDFQRTRPCTVPTVPPVMDSFFNDTGLDLEISTIGIITSNSYLPPLRVDRDTACGVGASACTYNVSFVAPALDCTDVTNQTDFSALLNPSDPPPGAPFCIYDTSDGIFNESDPMFISISTQDLVKGATQAINCTAHNATYDVGVNLDLDSTTVHVWNTTLHSNLVFENTFISAFADDAIGAMLGLVFAGPNGFTNTSGIEQLQHNAFFVTTSSGNHTWSVDVPQFPVSYMRNASISLLSGNINYNFSNETSSNLQYVNSTCSSTFTVYVYDPVRLLVPYGIALALAALVAARGCWLIIRNGEEEKIVFSHIVQIALNEKLFYISGDIHAKALVHLQRGDAGKLLPARSVDESRDDAYSLSSLETDKYGERQASYPRPSSWRGDPAHRHAYGVRTMTVIFLAAICSILLHHFYYHYLDGRSPSAPTSKLKSLCVSGCSDEIRNQAVVSDVGIALAYASQTLLATVIAISSMQLFWRRIRSQAIRISQIDALMNIRSNPFCPSFFRALPASFGLLFLALLAFSMSLLSVFTPGAIKISDSFTQLKGCTVWAPRNLTAVSVFNNTQLNSSLLSYVTPITTVLSSGTYLPPINLCDGRTDGPVQCEYIIDFAAPGFDCEDVTATSNSTGFTTPFVFQGVDNTNLFAASQAPQTDDLELQLSVQTYDFKRAVYQAVNCTGVLRQYSALVSHNTTSTVEVFESRTISTIHGNTSQPTTFPATYVNDIMSSLIGIEIEMVGGSAGGIAMTPVMMGNIGTFGLDGNMTWRDNMSVALEEFAQNATLSLLSGQIFSFNPEDPELLENRTTSCAYTFTAYKYTPYRLFLPYGIAVLVTVLCVIWGYIAIRRNGVEESMDFSRFLRAVLNDRMYGAREYLDRNTRVKADNTREGELTPLNLNY